jgi:hypothetical protein
MCPFQFAANSLYIIYVLPCANLVMEVPAIMLHGLCPALTTALLPS